MSGSVFYCHGLPGSEADLEWFQTYSNSRFQAVTLPVEARFEALTTPATKAVIVGFSLGAFSALKLAAAHPDRVERLVLVSPAGPLELGDFLDDMAGGAVFRAAQKPGNGFEFLTGVQALLGVPFPGLIRKILLSAAPNCERELQSDPGFNAAFDRGIRDAYGAGRAEYIRTVRAYVAPWADELDRVQCPVTIHQGEADTWTPPAMAKALAVRLGARASLKTYAGLGHFSTLRAVLAGEVI